MAKIALRAAGPGGPDRGHPGETLCAVYDCTGAGTGIVAVTNFRVILQDSAAKTPTGGSSRAQILEDGGLPKPKTALACRLPLSNC